MSLAGYLRILRPVNAVVSGLAAVLGYLIATGTLVPETVLLVIVVFLITGAGNVINDYFDQEIDRINRPDRPIPSGQVSPAAAWKYSAILFVAGLAICTALTPVCLAIAVFNSCLLVFYSMKLKNIALAGNLAVAYLSGSIFLFGGALAGTAGFLENISIAGITILAMVSRELLKDAEDLEGDRAGGAVTLPAKVGVRKTAVIAFLFATAAVILSFLPIGRWWGIYYIAAISVVDVIILASAGLSLRCTDAGCIKKSGSTTYLKIGMFLALLVFTIAAIIA
jgi:geranylgeranylglycerol-phosphate geranylgeranyltransferase